ncbi:MAG: type II toxin-antitoxin system VapC family toxin [Verrucomicrobia bacterium]|nr:type II toxin-antitoxin system VapC family toxin [Verrucomicrobiota bacterium]MCH8514202.1 type II toxin-antitoxin system VapC family toxin [Kiritimatiellia bacterium]
MTTLTHLLDTSVYCQRLKPLPHPVVVRKWGELGDRRLAISSICEAELLYGLHKRNSQRLWQEYHAGLENKLQQFPVDKTIAQRFAKMKAHMESLGQPRADFDLLIAATAHVHGLIVATGNVRHFQGLPEVKVENWFEE